mmetsp:Transcript_27381/g.26439  ORF Transcript_27381/g.26439 Transcript_27381/m.26439 type:complete len:91 (-) Transcript_27381:1340-1612(-)|eukprot:CAMPEP_0170553194 /NCGR_PEP_ID=MMETSP0211-20121228/11004_1 /TAXON_ID=311385 /ORGANISM="Pseudokeronopsis sp., Strain OXSARD2" /LENGTH=90 /DNA_ID=CAMNT_0010861349 /DNA_START=158 /DNA_END=430 /DNA_ORIENTATION=+
MEISSEESNSLKEEEYLIKMNTLPTDRAHYQINSNYEKEIGHEKYFREGFKALDNLPRETYQCKGPKLGESKEESSMDETLSEEFLLKSQ